MDQEDRLAAVAALRRDVNEGDMDAIGRETLQHEGPPFVRIGPPALSEKGRRQSNSDSHNPACTRLSRPESRRSRLDPRAAKDDKSQGIKV